MKSNSIGLKMQPHDKPLLTPNEVAEWLMVSPITVRSWAQKGLLAAEMTAGGHRRFRFEEVERFSNRQKATTTTQNSPASVRTGPLRVLIVDDDKFIVGFLQELLTGGKNQVVVEVAFDGFEAGRKVQSFLPDIILLDLMMPGTEGHEVCRQIKQIPGLSQVRIIGLSGYLSPEKDAEMIAAGAEACLAKPVDTRQLLTIMGLDLES